jgi:hypothetical protein
MSVQILIGADPEVFVFDKGRKDFVSAHGMVEGTKEKPTPVEAGAVQVDGMALEFNINPASTMEEFIHNINTVKKNLHQMIGVEAYDLVAKPSIHFSEKVWQETPKEAKELGCTPDFNAWDDGNTNPRPENDGTLRTGAGHVHIGWGSGFDVTDPDHLAACTAVVKQLDCSLGLASVQWDKDNERRKLYGKAGAFRPKPYGVEYRVLSNAWVNDEKLSAYVYSLTMKACQDLMEGKKYEDVVGGGNAVYYINSSDDYSCSYYFDRVAKKYALPRL